jgi:predicted amidophosphoribosyltransferase
VFEPVEKARRCSHCDAELPRGRHAAYCPYCGEQLEPMPCPQCGEVVEPIWNYCLGCGRSRHRPRITDAP